MGIRDELRRLRRDLQESRSGDFPDPAAYRAGVAEAVEAVDALIATGLPMREHAVNLAGLAQELQDLLEELKRFLTQSEGSADAHGRRQRLRTAFWLLQAAARRIEDEVGEATVLPEPARPRRREPRLTMEPNDRHANWLAAFLVSLANAPSVSDEDMVEVLRLADWDVDTLHRAALRIATASDVEPGVVEHALTLVERAERLARTHTPDSNR